MHLLIDTALHGAGLAVVMEEMVTSFIVNGRLIQELEDWSPPLSGYHLYYPSIGTPSVANAFTHFPSVVGEIRIYGGGAFQFAFDPTIDLLGLNFDTLNLSASNGEGAYAETGTLTYAYVPVPEPSALILFGAGLAGAAAVRRRHKKAA